MSNTINSNSLAQLNLLQQQRKANSANNQIADSTVTSQQLNDLQQALTQNKTDTTLTQSQQNSLNNLKNSLSTLPTTTQASILQELLNSASNDVSTYLTDKNLDSADITQGKNMAESLNLATDTLADKQTILDTSNSTADTITQDNIDDGTNTSGIVTDSLYANNGISNNGLDVSTPNNGLPVITFSNAEQLLASNLFNNCDPIMKSAMILLLFVNTTMANTMNNYDNQYISLKNNMDTLTNAQNYMQQVTGYMAANPTANINVFAALAYAENPNDPNLNVIGITSDNLAQYQQFVQSCPQFMAAFKAAFQQYQTAQGTSAESADQLALGDGTYTSILNPGDGQQTFSGQSQVMQYFTQPYNQAGYNISGLGSNPIFSNSWTDSTTANATNSPYTKNNSSSSNPLPAVQGNALTFNTSTVSSMIGSSGGTQNSTTNVLGGINQAMTTATTSNNTLQAQINAISNSINVIYNTVGGNLIPNTKIQF